MKRLVLFALLACFGSLAARDLTILRQRSYLREGPASYYNILKEIPPKAKVKLLRDGPVWLQVEFNNTRGYISAASTQANVKKGDPFTKLSRPSLATTTQGVTAGVKGFCAKFSEELKVNSSFPDLALATAVNPADYASFQRSSLQNRKLSQFHKAFLLPKRKQADYYSEAGEGFGLAVAGIIAGKGLYKNPPLAAYLNNLGTFVASAADTPEIQYRFFLLDISQPNAYACPGGYIFISKGMLQLVENEAQLAFVLAHEIAHVSRFHGLKEVKLMENQIGAEDVFAEMDRDMEEFSPYKNKEIEAELEADIREMASTLTEGRLDAYEEEADELATLFLVRSGYTPKAGEELLTKLLNTRYESNNQHYRRESVKQRLTLLQKKLNRFTNPRLRFVNDHPRFANVKALLDKQ